MANTAEYVKKIQTKIHNQDTNQPEFLQAVDEFFETVVPFLEENPAIEAANILELVTEPERIVQFRVPWQDDQGNWCINRGYRIQFNSALGPYKGGLRFHPTVNLSILKFLAFEQIFKNALTGLPIGGGKGGSDFDPKGKSDAEIMRFCQSFMMELSKHVGPNIDIPAGDIGVGGREIGYLYGMYKRLRGYDAGVLTGKPLEFWGSLARTEATGYGVVYFVKHLLNDLSEDLKNKRALVSGSGNVAIYAIEKLHELGAIVISCSDSDGYIIDETGIDVALLKEIKEVRRERLTVYAAEKDSATYYEGSLWSGEHAAELVFPCATQNEINEEAAKKLVKGGVRVVAEGANMPTSSAAANHFIANDVYYCPGKAANAGGVAVSALEMSQNSQRLQWTFKEVDQQLDGIMKSIYESCRDTAETFGQKNNFVQGANISGFEKVAKAMLKQGLV